MNLPRLHLVTDDRVVAAPGFTDAAERAVLCGGRDVVLQLRGPRSSGRRLYDLVVELRDAAEDAGARLIVNDRVDVALAAAAGGVHLGERSLALSQARALLGEGATVGASAHAPDRVAACARDGADYAFIGPVFATPSHDRVPGGGEGLVRAAVRAAGTLPVLGIGGITPERVPDVGRAGCYGVAVIRGVWDAPDPAVAVARYLEALAGAGSVELVEPDPEST